MILRDRVVRLRAPVVADGYGNQRRDWDEATSVIFPATVQPVTSDENNVDQDRTVSRWRCFLPPTADVEVTDRFIWDGVTHEVDGEVEVWKRRGRVHHKEAVLKKVSQR